MRACVYRDQKTTFVALTFTRAQTQAVRLTLSHLTVPFCFLWFYLFIFWFVFVFQTGPLYIAQAGLETQNSLCHALG